MHGRREPVVDTEPDEPRVCERLEQRPDIGALAALIETAAMHENGSGERAGAVRDVQIEQDGLAVRAGIFYILLVEE